MLRALLYERGEVMRKTLYGKLCKRWRITKTNYTQQQIADELGCTPAYVSRFEAGHADNADLLVWYLENGMPLNVLLEEGDL